MIGLKKRILLADDDPVVLKVTTIRLEREGFFVVPAPDGEEALKQALLHPFDLILIDAKMPKLDGFQTCERLKTDPSTASIPIILFTGSSDYWRGLTDQCIKLGVTDWLRKPFRSNELLEKVHRALGEEKKEDV